MPARHAAPKTAYRIRNWNQYNDALIRRGSITLWVDQGTLRAWRYQGPARRGAQFEDSDLAIQCLPTLRSVYHLTLRATEGFARSLFDLMGVDLPVPDSTTLCRRAAAVRITLPKRAGGPLHLVPDSTGLKVFGEGEWKARQHAKIKRHGNTSGPRLDRDENLRRIRQIGRSAWKAESGYHQRSQAEKLRGYWQVTFERLLEDNFPEAEEEREG
ncbi:MAG: transposase [Actinobacteria bacterium]|nr:transposase [Actinomycetota bacterium]